MSLPSTSPLKQSPPDSSLSGPIAIDTFPNDQICPAYDLLIQEYHHLYDAFAEARRQAQDFTAFNAHLYEQVYTLRAQLNEALNEFGRVSAINCSLSNQLTETQDRVSNLKEEVANNQSTIHILTEERKSTNQKIAYQDTCMRFLRERLARLEADRRHLPTPSYP